MKLITACLVLAAGLIGPPTAFAQVPRFTTAARPALIAACDLDGAPAQCGSCAGLTAAVPSIPADRVSSGPTIDGVLWTPLYVAERLQCLDAGLSLLRRGANPNFGGRDGALLAEVARSAVAEAAGATRVAKRMRVMDWLHRLGRYALDVDAQLPGGGTNRVVWSGANITDSDAQDMWSYALTLSATQPVLPDGGQPGSPDLPSPDTGVTRPSETAVARGVGLFDTVYRATGMFGVSARLQDCWAERRPPALTRQQLRWSYEVCAAMDLTASSMQEAALRRFPSLPPMAYFEAVRQDQRLQVFRQFAAEGLVPSAHRNAMARSMDAWLVVLAFAEPPRASLPNLPGARAAVAGGPTFPPTLIEPAAQPAYPEASRSNGEAGEVGLTLRVGEDGRVIACDVDRSSGFGALDDAARLTSLLWKFKPAQRNGAAALSFARAVASFTLPPGGAVRATLRQVGG